MPEKLTRNKKAEIQNIPFFRQKLTTTKNRAVPYFGDNSIGHRPKYLNNLPSSQ
jgi:hypothetical protein